jgi:hypothetical protein
VSGGFRLPMTALIGKKQYDLNTDYRDILEIFSCLEDPELPEFIRWQTAIELFFNGSMPDEDLPEAAKYLSWFITGGQEANDRPGPKLIDWQQDAAVIASDVNAVAGQEIRALPYLHWWTFLSWFHAIGQGQLSTLVTIRNKLRQGKKLEGWERDFYRDNKSMVDLKTRYSASEQQQQKRLKEQLGFR